MDELRFFIMLNIFHTGLMCRYFDFDELPVQEHLKTETQKQWSDVVFRLVCQFARFPDEDLRLRALTSLGIITCLI